ncbi:MAG: hypothetical protein ABII22_00085 [Candidatus Micrarchaeota archaeon]
MPDDDNVKSKPKGSSGSSSSSSSNQGFDISQLPSWFFYALFAFAVLNFCFTAVILILVAMIYIKP